MNLTRRNISSSSIEFMAYSNINDFPSQGMLGTTGGRFLGPSGSQPHRNLWPLHTGRGLDFQTNGEVTESIFAAGYNTPPTNSPFMSLSPLELVSKNFHSGTVAFSQANSIFVQSQTDFLGGTVATKKTETCFGRWDGIEPLQIQVPPLTTIASVAIKPDQKSSSSARSGKTDGIHQNSNSNSSPNLSHNSRHTDIFTNTIRTNDISSGCSRTIPISWTSAASSSTNNIVDSRNIGCSLLQIKREPCQVSEITTSNNLGPTPLTAVIKLESHSPKRTMDNMQNAAQNGIPVGIAVARQRLQEHAQQQHQHQPKEINRFGIGIATDLGGATSAFSQNMFFTGTNSAMIPFSSEAVTMGVSNVQNAVRTPPTLWQYPTSLPVESMVPMPIPPVGFQLVRDPSTGQFIFLPTATSLDKMYISYPEPFQQAVVWPSYPQQLQTPHLLMPPMAPLAQQMQPPPLTPIQLLGTDYLSGATLHQHTQTHSTRLVALTDNKRKSSLPNHLPATLIKIEDCSSATSGNTTTSAHHQQSHIFDPCKSTAIQTIATAVQTSSLTPELETHHQMYYHQSEGNLIQIASHSDPCASMIETRSLSPLSDRREMSPSNDNMDSMQSGPEVQDANIQTSPVMSEDDNTTGEDECTYPSNTSPRDDSTAITTSASYNDLCHNVSSLSEINSSNSFNHQDQNNTKATESSFDSNTTVTSSIIIEEISIAQPEPIILSSSYESAESIDTEHQQSISFTHKIHHAPDLSGLELLSNSIEAFEKKTFIKQEPIEKADMMYAMDTSITQNEPMDCSMQPKSYVSNNVTEPLGGLNLLCALAEQRFQEEVGQRSRKRSASTDGSDSKRQKKHHKDKQSNKKSSKKSKHVKERRDSRSKHQQSDEDDDDFVEKNLNDTFNRVKASYQKQCSCKNSANDSDNCCHDKCNFPTPEEVYSAMHTDMKQKLTAIAKEFQEEKRKLNEIKNLDKTNHSRESTPSSSSKSFSFDSEQSTKSEISPNICSSSQLETFQADSSKMHSDTDSMRFDEADTSSACKQRKVDAMNVVDSSSLSTIKSKSLVGYIFASKKRLNDSKTDNSSSMTDETSQSDINSIKQEVADDEELSQEALFGRTKRDSKSSKHQSKHKKSKSKDRKHRRSSESKSKKKKIDARCTLTGDQLDNLSFTSKPRVLTAMGGLFYAGCLSAVQPPDVYSVTLDGERGNRPHIMSREEILRDAILEVAPQSVDEVPPGARLCAYWSQQYRCLYPGTVAQPSSHDYEFDPKFIAVEFDDGDSGRIALEDIRFLLSDYPIVDYDPNPLLSLGKRKQRSSHSENYPTSDCANEPTTSTNCFNIFKDKIKSEGKEAHKERRRLKKIRKDKNKQENISVDRKHKHKHKCNDEFCKHRKHKKRRKHKKHYHREAESPVEVKNEVNEEETLAQGDTVSQTDDSNEQNDDVFHPEIKEETMTEEEATSSVTESSGSTYQPGKKKERQNSAENNSKIAAFLPARQLWAWSGKGIKRSGAKGRGKKQFYRTIQRGKETISVGDSAVFLSTGRPDRPYIGRIECMWETSTNNRIVRVKWYYHPEETTGCPKLVYPGGLFQSPHEDENDVQTISHKCKVLPFDQYTEKYGPDPKQYESVYDNNDTFYLAGHYDPTSIILTLENHIPSSSKASDKKNNKETK